jgi:intein/homing endonuclease
MKIVQTKKILMKNQYMKMIKIPSNDEKLAEFIGIILGDGNIHCFIKGNHIRTYMIRIAGDYRKDHDYLTNYVANLVEELFSIKVKFYKSKTSNVFYAIIHSKNIINFFESMGLKSGNKIKNQSTIPKWI